MLLIHCPHCGPREQSEFSYGGIRSPLPALDGSTSHWHMAVHLRPGAQAVCEELWYHEAGCECWITLRRDQRTHEFVAEAEP
ncbi:sarcosine oxidase subunit delta [Phaeobacter sp. C3_T13_0]|uniref:sarcosine oxidase subunit delta n=1 Tax=Phaeobacter cretensis TaxID=3342641 RepID=UPI0039BD5B3D